MAPCGHESRDGTLKSWRAQLIHIDLLETVKFLNQLEFNQIRSPLCQASNKEYKQAMAYRQRY
jgi:hypothetical protein